MNQQNIPSDSATNMLGITKYNTHVWSVVFPFETSPFNITCEVVEYATDYPKDGSAQELEREIWNHGVDEKVKQLEKEGKLELKLEEDDGRKSLYGKEPNDKSFARVMVPGKQYRLVDFDPWNNLLSLEPTIFSESVALQYKEYRDVFRNQGLSVPFGPIAPVLMITTSDGLLVASKRGTATPKYPGVLWGFGGDVDDPNITIGDHLIKIEKQQELHSVKGNSTYSTIGITFDNVLHKHDLVVHAQYDRSHKLIKKGAKFLPDVESVIPIEIRDDELRKYITENYVNTLDHASPAWIDKPSGAFSSGLFLLGKKLYGDEWADETFKYIEMFYQKVPSEVSMERIYAEK